MSPVMLAIASTPEIARISDVNWAHQRSGLPAGRAMCAWSSDGAAKPATTSVSAIVTIATTRASIPDFRGPK